jgi:hypothetical protein
MPNNLFLISDRYHSVSLPAPQINLLSANLKLKTNTRQIILYKLECMPKMKYGNSGGHPDGTHDSGSLVKKKRKQITNAN